MSDINWLAVIVGTIAHQALGALWYGVLFRKMWLTAMGMTPEEVEMQSPGSGLALGAVCSLVSVIALALLMSWGDHASVTGGICIGAVTGIGMITAATFMNGFYEQKKPVLSILFGAYYTLGLMIAGAILGAWQ